jgi:pyruvate/2-oxoglutarate/acetoin dehydrogenase E1 component
MKKMREWILENQIASQEELAELEEDVKDLVKHSRDIAWHEYIGPIKAQAEKTVELLRANVVNDIEAYSKLQKLAKDLENNREPLRRDVMHTLSLAVDAGKASPFVHQLKAYYTELKALNKSLYNSHLYNEGPKSSLKVAEVKPVIAFDAPNINGYEVLNRYFDKLFANNPKVVAFGEDLGLIGDVNQGFAGLQEKYGDKRIFDTGIRELTIMGQGIGLALRGLRPIAEIQYLDYLVYGLQPLTDDAACLHYRTKGLQSCPLIVRTRGHRLEGIWHSGSPMGMILGSLRGFYVCVPRNMVQAAGMYNTLLQGSDPGLMIECLNGYRLKEKLPENLLEFTVPLGIPDILKEGDDITVVSYGATLRIVQDATVRLEQEGIHCEIIDVQTLLPFDINHIIGQSLRKTNRIVFVDEDSPGGGAAFMYNRVMEEQGGFRWLDVAPRTITAKEHRPAYGSDGDYFSKPNAEEIAETVREMLEE